MEGCLGPGGAVCSGHGECVLGECVCSPGWSGANDFHDFAGRDCHSPRFVNLVLFALALLQWLKLWFVTVRAFRLGWQQHNAQRKAGRRSALRPYWRTGQGVILECTMLVAVPTSVMILVLKLATERTIGKDPVISATYLVGMLSGWPMGIKVQADMIHPFVNGFGFDAWMRRVMRNYYMAAFSGVALYTIGNVVTVTMAIHLQNKADRIAERDQTLHTLIVIRQTMSMAFFLFQAVVIVKFTGLVLGKRKALARTGSRDEATQQVLEELSDIQRGARSRVVLVVVLAAIFSLPGPSRFMELYTAITLLTLPGKNHYVYMLAANQVHVKALYTVSQVGLDITQTCETETAAHTSCGDGDASFKVRPTNGAPGP